jgi:hypothetical protein
MPTLSAGFHLFMRAVFYSISVWTVVKIAPRQDHLLLMGVLDKAVAAPLGHIGIV